MSLGPYCLFARLINQLQADLAVQIGLGVSRFRRHARKDILEHAELTYDMFAAPAVKMVGRDYHGHGPASQGH